MKRFRKIIAVIIILTMSLSLNIWNGADGVVNVYADTTFTITSPVNNAMMGAGYMDIKCIDKKIINQSMVKGEIQ